MRAHKTITVAAAAFGAVLLAAAPAAADSGSVNASGGGGQTSYADASDTVTVCDTASDGHGAAGYIEVQQANGSWNRFAKIYAGGGAGTCVARTQDVQREAAPVRIVACLQDGAAGAAYRCNSIVISG